MVQINEMNCFFSLVFMRKVNDHEDYYIIIENYIVLQKETEMI
jgi:hypothetical protein